MTVPVNFFFPWHTFATFLSAACHLSLLISMLFDKSSSPKLLHVILSIGSFFCVALGASRLTLNSSGKEGAVGLTKVPWRSVPICWRSASAWFHLFPHSHVPLSASVPLCLTLTGASRSGFSLLSTLRSSTENCRDFWLRQLKDLCIRFTKWFALLAQKWFGLTWKYMWITLGQPFDTAATVAKVLNGLSVSTLSTLSTLSNNKSAVCTVCSFICTLLILWISESRWGHCGERAQNFGHDAWWLEWSGDLYQGDPAASRRTACRQFNNISCSKRKWRNTHWEVISLEKQQKPQCYNTIHACM